MQLKIIKIKKKVKQNFLFLSLFCLFFQKKKTKSVFVCVWIFVGANKRSFLKVFEKVKCIRKYMQSKNDLLLSFKY